MTLDVEGLPPGHFLLRPLHETCIIERSEAITAEEALLSLAVVALAADSTAVCSLEAV